MKKEVATALKKIGRNFYENDKIKINTHFFYNKANANFISICINNTDLTKEVAIALKMMSFYEPVSNQLLVFGDESKIKDYIIEKIETALFGISYTEID